MKEKEGTLINEGVEDEEEERDDDLYTDDSGYSTIERKHQNKKRDYRCKKLRECLRFVSVGKYEMKLYHRGSDDLSSSLGGVITLIVIFIVIYFAA
jgi:hypothetical protein